MAAQSPPLSPSTSTPEYLTFKKCYQTIVHHVKQQPGAFCDALFARSYITPTIRDYTRNDFVGDEAKAHKMVDTLMDLIEYDRSVYHGFIEIAEGLGPWAETLVNIMSKSFEEECKLQVNAQDKRRDEHSSDSGDEAYHSANEELSMETTFPFLDVSSLTEESKEDLEAQLRSDVKTVKKKFSEFSVGIRKSLERQGVPLDDIKEAILTLDAFTDGIGVRVLDTEDEKRIESAQTAVKVFLALRKYISFFNYEIIEHIIHVCGSPADKRKMDDYLDELNKFCKRNVFEVPPEAYSCSRPDAKEFVIKYTEGIQELKVEDVRVIREKVADMFGLRYSTLQLFSIRKGCVEIHFLISAAVADHIFPVSPAQLSALSEFGVKVLTPHKRSPLVKQTTSNQATETQVVTNVRESESAKVKWREAREFPYQAGGEKGTALLIIPKLSPGSSDPQVVPRRTRTEPLSDEERALLEEQGVPRDCQDNDITIMKATYHRSMHYLWIVQSESTEEVREQIVKAMGTDSSDIGLHFIGPGKKGTGDWCFSDGFITFRDLMELYTRHFKRCVLTIVSDCSYSGNWVREAMALMDEQGVGPCGHVAKEKGIFVKVFASCLANEIPTELAYSTHGTSNIATTTGMEVGNVCDLEINDQHTCGRDFTQIHCKNERIDQPCTMAPGSTWHQWSIQERVFRYNGISNDRLAWYILLAKDDDETIWKFRDKTQGENAGKGGAINIEDYGRILRSGWGWEPTFEAKRWIVRNLLVNYNYDPLSDASN